MKSAMTTLVRLVAGAAVLLQAGCGTILYPSRRGQKTTAHIDAGVAVLDAVGLLFFIIPGVIAFAVDFNNGAIYLPSGERGLLNLNEPEKRRFDPGEGSQAFIERVLREKTGLPVRLDEAGVRAYRLESPDDIPATAEIAAWPSRR